MHLAIYDAKNAANAIDFLKAVKAAFPFKITHILIDHGSCFTADAFEKLCKDQGVDRRRTRACSPQTNGMVERFDGRVATEVLPINVAHHADLEALLCGCTHAYNQRRQRVLNGLAPAAKVAERRRQQPGLRNRRHKPVKDAEIMDEADRIMIYANDVSQPDTFRVDVDHGLCNVDPTLFDVGQRCQIVANGANIFRTDKRVFELT